MFADELYKIFRCISSERRFGEVRISGNEVFVRGVNVREVAPSAAGDDDLTTNLGVALENDHLSSSLTGLDRAKESGRTATDNDDVESQTHSEYRSLRMPK